MSITHLAGWGSAVSMVCAALLVLTSTIGVFIAVPFGIAGVVLCQWIDRLGRKMRAHGDEFADVAAIMLAKNPASLGALCARLAADSSRDHPTGMRSQLLWFETSMKIVDTGKFLPADPQLQAQMNTSIDELHDKSRVELIGRAVAAYAEARIPLPETVSGWATPHGPTTSSPGREQTPPAGHRWPPPIPGRR